MNEPRIYRKKPVQIQAVQWFKNGDHPEDGPSRYEGEVVRYYSHPDIPEMWLCTKLMNPAGSKCSRTMRDHGWIDTLEDGHTVCPSDFIITGVEGEKYPCKAYIFKKTYEEL